MIDLEELYGIDSIGVMPLSECVVNKRYLLEREGIGDNGSVLIFLLPYYTSEGEGGNVSMYSVAEDYHRFAAELFENVIPRLLRLAPDRVFAGFADHAPIVEVDAAAKAGLGVWGENGLLISRAYSSFVFIGGIYSTLPAEEWKNLVKGADLKADRTPGRCPGCGACRRACPAGAIGDNGSIDRVKCLSAVTQKKKLTESEEGVVAEAEFVWGCDICQLVCPITKAAKAAGTLETKLEYFRQKLIKTLDAQTLDDLSSSGEFKKRAFSWRGEETVRRNLKLHEEQND